MARGLVYFYFSRCLIITHVSKRKNTTSREALLIRGLVREELTRLLGEDWWAESYDKALVDDPAFQEDSVLVPNDIKDTIKKWTRAMKLDGR